jgi:uncharacterized protein
MIFNVAQLMKSPVGTSLKEDIYEDQIQLDEDLTLKGALTGYARLRRVNQGVLADGSVDLTLELTCVRCLKTFDQPLHLTFEERFYPTIDIITGSPLPPIEEDDVFAINDHHEIDLTEAIRQDVLLAIPMVTLCKEDCAGLCAQCGHDLNLGACNCETEANTPFGVLKTLLQNQS